MWWLVSLEWKNLVTTVGITTTESQSENCSNHTTGRAAVVDSAGVVSGGSAGEQAGRFNRCPTEYCFHFDR